MSAELFHSHFGRCDKMFQLVQDIIAISFIRIVDTADTENGKSFGQTIILVERVECRHQFAFRQVARSAEYDHYKFTHRILFFLISFCKLALAINSLALAS